MKLNIFVNLVMNDSKGILKKLVDRFVKWECQ